jgi:hypothetical protein
MRRELPLKEALLPKDESSAVHGEAPLLPAALRVATTSIGNGAQERGFATPVRK